MKKTNKKNNEYLIWSSNIYEQFGTQKEIVEMWKETCEINSYPKDWETNKGKALENAYLMIDEYFEDVWMNLSSCKDAHKYSQYLIIADIGRWDGRYAGGSIVAGLRYAIEKCMSGEDYSKIYVKNNHVYVDTANHDGSSHFKLLRLTQKGEDFFRNHQYDLTDRELHQRLAKNRHYWNCAGTTFKEVYGW